MAAVNSSPSGFSYAQAAAKASAPATNSQTPSSKVTSGTATPATGTFSELAPNSNWADDVEANEGDKPTESRKSAQKQAESSQAKDSAVERTKSESRVQNGSSGVSSPDLTASSSTTNTDDASSAPSGTSSSETTWDTKSQNSEPAWIAERKERQSGPEEPRGKRGKKEGKESKEGKEAKEAKEAPIPQPPPKPVVLHDAPPPAVNPWAKRMEDAKSKPAAPISTQSLSRPAPQAPHVQATLKENQRPRADSRKKANSVTSVAREAEAPATGDVKKAGGVQGKRANQVRPKSRQGSSKPATEDARTDSTTAPGRPAQREHQSLPNLNTAPPPVKDEVSWPTPETAQESQRKEAAATEKGTGKDTDENGDAEQNSGAKSRPKTTWKPVPVTPTIVWETEEMNRPRGQGERGGRGGARGRGGFRGAPNGTKGGDRAAARGNGSPEDADAAAGAGQRGRSNTVDREAMPPPPKPVRPSSASGSRDGRKTREHSFAGRQRFGKGSTDAVSGSDNAATTISFSDARRAKSPTKMDDGQDVKIPEPIPRQSPSESQRESSREDESSREGSASKATHGEGKKERSFEGHNGKEWNGAPRGGKRGGRGRGGSREFINGHQANQMFTNGHAIDFAGGNPFASPNSPSAYQPSRGQFSSYGQGRGGWPRNSNPRSQSIPVDSPYAGARPYWPQQPPPMQAYYPSMYDFSAGVPMSAVPYSPMMDQQYLMDMVSTQLEYYFSIDNLIKDMFLRRNMDSQGFVLLDIIANFNRIKQLTQDKEILKAVCLRSDNIEIRVGDDGKERLRRHNQWEQFLLPMDQRDAGAQNEGPQNAKRPEHPQIHIWSPPMSGRPPPYAPQPGQQRRSYDSGYGMNGTVPPFAPFSPLSENPFGDVPNGDEIRGRAAKSPIRDISASPTHQAILCAADGQDTEADVFPDEHAGTLTVVVKMNPQRAHHAAARTFSNGSIDTRSVFNDLDKTVESQPATNGEPVVNGEKKSPSITRLSSPGAGRSPEKTNGANELMLLWVKDKEVPQDNLPQNATLEPYFQLHQKALDQRKQAATGTCPYDLDVLYQFWSHFLIRNFNRRMYAEFKTLAHGDAEERHNKVGLQNLVQFYAKSLDSSSTIRDHVANDYVQLVKNEPQITKDLAFKQLRSAWRNGALNLKNRKKLTEILDEPLRAQLES
ncbi:hypothetical protein PRZ48_001226 [Zasmidium cellare]|uniref:HTH La-type RNA-binding domain-containing protein n=1 Tax=Zasmidium cellare TaxID=395010 RepID=A0ABR0F285_ZASCE|nr:hypothetical protein PRZ48_001226 [Zasmidium cellare]